MSALPGQLELDFAAPTPPVEVAWPPGSWTPMACGRRPPEAHVYVARWRDLPSDTWKRGWLCVRSEGCQEVDRNSSDDSAKNSPAEGS